MPSRSYQFRHFVAQCLGTGKNSPLREPGEGKSPLPGAVISALVEAFLATHPFPAKKEAPSELPDFTAEVYREPWTVYAIRNRVTGEVYVGTAQSGFTDRYPRGEWWLKSHHERLKRDALMYGVRSFYVAIHVCHDKADMRRTEAAMIRSMRPLTYNEKPEADTLDEPCDD